VDRQGFQDWLDRYVEAWKSYDPDQIGALFSEDATYAYQPNDTEIARGRDAIVKDWLDDPDEKGTYDAEYKVLAIDGDVHVAEGWSRYFNPDGSTRDEYSNIYICHFNEAGECTDFVEYWIQGREYRKAAVEEIKRKAIAGEG